MKYLLSISVAMICISQSCLSQTLINYLKKGGLQTVADIAHPTNTLILNSCQITNDEKFVQVSLVYKEAKTILNLYKGGFPLYIKKIEIEYDNDIPGPFQAITLFKEIVMAKLNEEERKNPENNKSEFEKAFQKAITDWDRFELALFILNMDIIDKWSSINEN